MRFRRIFLATCALALMAATAIVVWSKAEPTSAGIAPPTPPGGALFGAAHLGPDGLSTLYTIDPSTGAASPVGPIGFERVSGMDFDQSGTLYATGERADGSDTHVLLTIDPLTGAGTEVGPTGVEILGFGNTVADISFGNLDGALYAYLEASDGLGTIDPASGAAVALGGTGVSCCGNGMAFLPDDTLLHGHSTFSSPPAILDVLNQTTGAATFLIDLSFGGGFDPGTGSRMARPNAMDLRPSTGELFASVVKGSGTTRENFVATIDPTTGIVTIIGPTADGLDALAFAPPAAAAQFLLIDIKPGSDPNVINPTSQDDIPVAILSTADFDARTQIDLGSLTFGRTGDEQSLAFCPPGPEDVNGDGLFDEVCKFTTKLTGFQCNDTQGILRGNTKDGVPLEGRDSVRISPSACPAPTPTPTLVPGTATPPATTTPTATIPPTPTPTGPTNTPTPTATPAVPPEGQPEMSLTVKAPSGVCDGEKCTLEVGSSFTLSVEVVTAPAAGYVTMQTFIDYGADLTYNKALATAEIVWPDAAGIILSGQTGPTFVNHAALTGLLPPLPVSTFTGNVVEISMTCSAGASSSVVELIPLGDPRAGGSGAGFVEADGFTQHPTSDTLTINCGAPLVAGLDTDGDGCTNVAEVQTVPGSQTTGGLRDPLNPWDFYDVNGDGSIDVPGDILQVILAYQQGPLDPGGPGPNYSPSLDRGAAIGAFVWNRAGPDGHVDVPNDVLPIIFQYLHSCE